MRRFVRLIVRVTLTWLVACVALAALIVVVGLVDRPVASDAIVVLGAALTDEGAPGKALTRRSEHAAALWHQGQAPTVICTGGTGPGAWIQRSEADGCREVLMRLGVPRDRILLEERSRNTLENARYARDIMVPRGWRRALVVSDSYHVCRARYLFWRVGIEASASPVSIRRLGSPLFYVFSVVREVGAFHAQAFR